MTKPSAAQAAYWEKQLARYGLTMDRGRSINTLTYGNAIEHFGELEGKIVYSPPTGERTDSGEWIISLP